MNNKSCSISEVTLPLLALDIGGKRIGVAVSDRLGFSCRGITCLFRNDQGWPKQVNKLVTEYGIKGLIVGLPKNMDGTEGSQAEIAAKLRHNYPKPLIYPYFFKMSGFPLGQPKNVCLLKG